MTSPQQTQLLNKMAMAEPLPSSRALSWRSCGGAAYCLNKMRQRQHKAELQRIKAQLQKIGGVADEEQRLLTGVQQTKKNTTYWSLIRCVLGINTVVGMPPVLERPQPAHARR